MGFGLALAPSKTWTPKGQGRQFAIPTCSNKGRLNLIGVLDYASNTLSYRDLEGNANAQKCFAFLNDLAQQADPSKLTVVVLDNAPFHHAKLIENQRESWQKQGLFLRFLPPYSPHLNPIETLWRKLKGFLLPRRCYPSLSELKQAVFSVLKSLNAIIM